MKRALLASCMAAFVLIAGCHRQESQDEEQPAETLPDSVAPSASTPEAAAPVAPAPAAEKPAPAVADEPKVDPQLQVAEDADATGMTSRRQVTAQDAPPANETEPAQ